MIVRIGICDDESRVRLKTRQLVEKYLKMYELTYEIYEFSSGEELLASYPQSLDVLLLDITMGQLNGIETAKEIRSFDSTVDIIFLTSLMEFMQEGYVVRAYRYLLKPLDYKKVLKHVMSCIEERLLRQDAHLLIQNRGVLYRIDIPSILYIETKKPGVLIHTSNRTYEIRMSLSELERRLSGYPFFRSHKSYFIHLVHVDRLLSNAVRIQQEEVPVSKHRIRDLKLSMLKLLGDQ